MYTFTFLINGSILVEIVDSKIEDAKLRAKKLVGYEITNLEIQSIYERN